MRFKLCIIAAGQGARVSTWQTLHKGLLPVGNVAVISRIIEKFPLDTEIVIVGGYKQSQLEDFIQLAHPQRPIAFVTVDRWHGVGSGPGYSLLAAADHLQCPFIFTGCDTLVEETVPPPTVNWIGVASVTDTKDYLMAAVANNRVIGFHDKVDQATLAQQGHDVRYLLSHAFIGLAGVYDWRDFWQALAVNRDQLVKDELQVSNGLTGLLNSQPRPIPFTWHDTGSDSTYQTTRRQFSEVVAPKPNEHLYMQGEAVIKFFADTALVTARVARAQALLGLVPTITGVAGQFFRYTKVPGRLLTEVHDLDVFDDFLAFCRDKLWQPVRLAPAEQATFVKRCDEFYQQKTAARVHQFHASSEQADRTHRINGTVILTVKSLLEHVDWTVLAQGVPVRFHGDLQPENIIVTPDRTFTLIDWRQDFAGLQAYGDLYYDLAKLDHALLVNGEIIRRNQYKVQRTTDGAITLEWQLRSHLIEYRQRLHEFIRHQGWDLQKVTVLTSLIYLNIAPLHHVPYNEFLYYLGKYLLHATFKESDQPAGNLRQREATTLGAVSPR